MADSLSITPIRFAEQTRDDDFQVEYEVNYLFDILPSEENHQDFSKEIASLEAKQRTLQKEIDDLDINIDRLTNKADSVDYSVAVACGVLCGLIDSFVVGEFDFEGALKKTKEGFNQFVQDKALKVETNNSIKKAIANAKKKAAKEGRTLSSSEIAKLKQTVREGVAKKFTDTQMVDPERALRLSISKLEKTFKLPTDNLFLGKDIGVNSSSHHLDELAHHPTLLGMMAAILGVFIKAGFFSNKNGRFRLLFTDNGWKEVLKDIWPLVISGILTFLLYFAKSKKKEDFDEKIPKPLRSIMIALAACPAAIKVLDVINNWLGHLASDMAGSKSTPGGGMGIPGFFVSMLKEVSGLYPLNKTGLPKVVDNIFTQNRFDMRAEMAVINQLGKQAIPVLLGELIVRLFYFIRHLLSELANGRKLVDVDWQNIIPFNNRTIARMITVESGTFMAMDIADATIRSAIKNGPPNNPLFWKDLILRINFVGIGRFAIAVGTDIRMGVQRTKAIEQRLSLVNAQLALSNAVVFYQQAEMWAEAENAAQAIINMENNASQSMVVYAQSLNNLINDWNECQIEAGRLAANDDSFGTTILEILD